MGLPPLEPKNLVDVKPNETVVKSDRLLAIERMSQAAVEQGVYDKVILPDGYENPTKEERLIGLGDKLALPLHIAQYAEKCNVPEPDPTGFSGYQYVRPEGKKFIRFGMDGVSNYVWPRSAWPVDDSDFQPRIVLR